MSDYTALQSDLIQYAWRDGEPVFEGAAPGMIRMAEAHFNRELSLRVMETALPMTGTTGSRFLPLPDDFAEAISLHLTSDGGYFELRPDNAGEMMLNQANGRARAWALDGMNIALDTPCDGPLTFSFRYRAKFALSDDKPTNWLLQNHPDLYLSASLAWGAAHSLDDASLAKWKALAEEAMNSVRWSESRGRLTTATVDPALRSGGGFDVRTG